MAGPEAEGEETPPLPRRPPRRVDSEPPLVIAMKGHPGTGKSTVARSLSTSLRIPLLDKDDVRDSTLPLQLRLQPHDHLTRDLLNDLSYEVVFRIAATQLAAGLTLILDSPLSSRSRLDRLLRVASSCGGHVAIVECVTRDVALWHRRLEGRSAGWHKPSTWQDLERLLEGYNGCTDYDVGGVPKLVVDTTREGVGVEEIAAEVAAFVAGVRDAAAVKE